MQEIHREILKTQIGKINYQCVCMTIAAANIISINLLSKSRAAGISDKKDADTILSITHKRT